MRTDRRFVLSGCLFLVTLGIAAAPASTAETPSFTLSAPNVTMPPSGSGSAPFTLTSIDGYTGSILVSCSGANAAASARVPLCTTVGPLPAPYILVADGTVKGSFDLLPYGDRPPAALLSHAANAGLAGLALMSALLLGCRVRRGRYPLPLTLLAIMTLAGLSFLIACGGNPGMTPGTYPYTITATDIHTNAAMSTNATVTVP